MNILNIDYEKYTLENGLEIILYPNISNPLVSVNIWYKVGSANEVETKKGLAHLFEHMMFQGSEHIPKDMHFKYIQKAGGTLNGSTSFDKTNFYEKLPSNALELALWLESDRMGFLLPAINDEKLKNQIDVVSNERKERYDNQPYGLTLETLLRNLYTRHHPYHSATIGNLKDIQSFTLEDVHNFYNEYYSPSNAVLVIAGDFNKEEAKYLIQKYFGDLTNSSNNVVMPNFEMPPLDKKCIELYEDVQLERINLAWHTVKSFEEDETALDILSDILSGSKSSRLYKRLVYDLEIAQEVSAYQYTGKYGGHFIISAFARPDKSLDDIKKEIFNLLDELITTKFKENEIKKSVSSIKSSFIYSMENIDVLADYLNYYNFYLGEPNSFNYDLKRYSQIDEESIKKVADKYLKKNFIELRTTNKEKINA